MGYSVISTYSCTCDLYMCLVILYSWPGWEDDFEFNWINYSNLENIIMISIYWLELNYLFLVFELEFVSFYIDLLWFYVICPLEICFSSHALLINDSKLFVRRLLFTAWIHRTRTIKGLFGLVSNIIYRSNASGYLLRRNIKFNPVLWKVWICKSIQSPAAIVWT